MGGSVALLLHRKAPDYWDGAILLAPMCKVMEQSKMTMLAFSFLLKPVVSGLFCTVGVLLLLWLI